jgi:hypothetical protein
MARERIGQAGVIRLQAVVTSRGRDTSCGEAPVAKKSAQKDYLKPKAGKNPQYLGKVVAEQDPELQDYYVDQERYVARALDFKDSAVFFVGPKGAGKSAILQIVRLIRAPDQGRIINLSPDDLAFSALANVNATTPIPAGGRGDGRDAWDPVTGPAAGGRVAQEGLAARSDLPVTSLRNWERDHRTPRVLALFKLAQALGLPMERFVEGVEGDDTGPAAGGERPPPRHKPRRRRLPKARGS